MLLRLLLVFVTVPLVELYLLLQVAEVTGAATTFLLVIITGIIGSWLAKREGLIAWQKFQLALAEGRMPSREIQDGLMIVFSAALLLTPGLLTDLVGFVMLVPVGRNLIRKFVLAKLFRGFGSVHVHTTTTFDSKPLHPFDDSNTIDGKATHREHAR
ncbi:phage T7 F exclusion suppressor FxsA [Stieleria maiorica]|uniref:Phage T7 F exclusion suppressor FxsA n=1 Tax=Stieleria maiorica TaxID=2795974 RepID=A0A5B9MQU4_9BACT|nr:FxsA family protein [Stieleria maiorica]QEG02830.1 phage T7 F exclusion suppressor FxsA [Stieleria maiorica]